MKVVDLLFVVAFLARSSLAQNCAVANRALIGNGWCNWDEPGYNTRECRWDGGDCCRGSCISQSVNRADPQAPIGHECGSNGFMCFDPLNEDDVVSFYILSQNQDRRIARGLANPFASYQADASSIGSESFGSLAAFPDGTPVCPRPNATLTELVNLDCVPIAGQFRIAGAQMFVSHDELGEVAQNMLCGLGLVVEFVPRGVTMANIQVYIHSNNSLSSTDVFVTSRHSLDISEQDTRTLDFATGERFMEFGLMSLKGATIAEIEFSDWVCLNRMTIFSGTANVEGLSESGATPLNNVPLASIVACAVATLLSFVRD